MPLTENMLKIMNSDIDLKMKIS